jgi:reactive intermediate/imine deaminase
MNDAIFIIANSAPRPFAPFSHAVEAGGFLFVTGQMPIDPKNPDAPLPDGIAEQTRMVLANLSAVVTHAGYSFGDAVAVRAFLRDFNRDYKEFNAVYETHFERGRLPARTTVGVTGLARDALVEIDMICRKT